MRIGLNLLHAHVEIGGVWNYIANLINALGEYDHNNAYVTFVTEKSQKLVPEKPNFDSISFKINPSSRFCRILYENSLLNHQARRSKIDCMHWFANVQSPFSTIPSVVTVHDLMVYQRPELFPLVKRIYLYVMFRLTAARARVILPVSLATKNDLKRVLKPRTKSIIVLPMIIDEQFKSSLPQKITDFRKKYALPQNYFLYVAHTYPHKNHIRLLRAYRSLKIEGFNPWPLVLRGDAKSGEIEIQNEIKKLSLGENLIRLPRIPYSELPTLYSGAGALIYPSLLEGGGMPVIEAMACGCPVAASSLPATQEFAGEAALFFNPGKIDDICKAMITLQQDKNFCHKSRKKGVEIVKRFSGRSIVEKLLYAYKAAATS